MFSFPSLPGSQPSSLFPEVNSDDPFAVVGGGASVETSLFASGGTNGGGGGGVDPFSCLHMPPPKSDSGSLAGSARGTGANTPASFHGDAFGVSSGAADPFGAPAASIGAPSGPDAFDPFGFNTEVTEATKTASGGVAFNGGGGVDLFGGLAAPFTSATNESAKSAPPFPSTAETDDPFSPKGNV